MAHIYVKLKKLIELVKEGGTVKTGLDTYTRIGKIISDKEHVIDSLDVLEQVGQTGQTEIPVSTENGYMWDENGRKLLFEPFGKPANEEDIPILKKVSGEIKQKIKEITDIKRYTKEKYRKAKNNIKKVILDIKETGGSFDSQLVEDTVTDILTVITENESAFSYMTKEIFSYDDYLYNHSINVCTIGCVVLNKYNKYLINLKQKENLTPIEKSITAIPFSQEQINSISVGYFMHDIGKVLIPDNILNKQGKLTDKEFLIVKTHSFQKGPIVLAKNSIENPLVVNSVKNHHAEIFENESRCYPLIKYSDMESYVKICKLADIYDAMTSKRSYKEAFNPRNVVKGMYNEYNGKDDKLQTILHAFVGSIGIYPPGSFVFLNNGQMAYVLDTNGPLIIPFTDNPNKIPDPFNVSENKDPNLMIDDNRPKIDPENAYKALPPYLKELVGI
ncbi:MAG: HD domain-containing protein [Desulfobacterales bacterium]|nr:HD domain-containing protein [Desulfobacterales bacterium]